MMAPLRTTHGLRILSPPSLPGKKQKTTNKTPSVQARGGSPPTIPAMERPAYDANRSNPFPSLTNNRNSPLHRQTLTVFARLVPMACQNVRTLSYTARAVHASEKESVFSPCLFRCFSFFLGKWARLGGGDAAAATTTLKPPPRNHRASSNNPPPCKEAHTFI